MNISVAFSMCSLIFILTTTIIYFSKENVSNFDNKIYRILLSLNIIGLIIDIVGFFSFSKIGTDSFINIFIAKIYLIYYLSYVYCLLNYVCNLAIKGINVKLKKLLKYYLLLVLILICLPINIEMNDKIAYTYGISVNFAYAIAFLFIGIMLFLVIKYHKNLKGKQLAPLLLFIFLTTLVAIIQKITPEITLMLTANSLVTFIMYHTIENPDAKMLYQMEFSKNEAEKANRAKSDFLSSMSHEIRTPLNAIVGLSEDMKSYSAEVPKEVLEDIEDIKGAADTLLEIVGNILDINKIEGGQMDIVEVEYNFKQEVLNMAKISAVRIGDKPIEFEVNMAEDIPDILIGDKVHIKEIINNLLTNAFKYTEKGKVSLTVKCINLNNKCKLMISVEDTGRGIKKEDIEKLFTKFQRLEEDKNTSIEGTGLGLAITKALVNLMGGTINVQSNFGKGSLFVLNIVQKISDKETSNINNNYNYVKKIKINKVEELELLSNENDKEQEKKKILIVDDNNLNIKVVTKLLSNLPYELDTCSNGLECLEKIRAKEQFDLILMDIMMPKMGGEATLKELQKIENFKTPVIALTADAIASAEDKYKNQGFVDYLAKPFKKEELEQKIQKQIK